MSIVVLLSSAAPARLALQHHGAEHILQGPALLGEEERSPIGESLPTADDRPQYRPGHSPRHLLGDDQCDLSVTLALPHLSRHAALPYRTQEMPFHPIFRLGPRKGRGVQFVLFFQCKVLGEEDAEVEVRPGGGDGEVDRAAPLGDDLLDLVLEEAGVRPGVGEELLLCEFDHGCRGGGGGRGGGRNAPLSPRRGRFDRDDNDEEGEEEYLSILRTFEEEAGRALVKLDETYGGGGGGLSSSKKGGGADASSIEELTKKDAVTLMDGWNKVLAFESAWKEACWLRWRILEARIAVRRGKRSSGHCPWSSAAPTNIYELTSGEEEEKKTDDDRAAAVPIKRLGNSIKEKSLNCKTRRGTLPGEAHTPIPKAELYREARRLVESNEDPLAVALGPRTCDGKNLMLSLFDGQIRSLCPHTQNVQREAYRPVADEGGAEAYGFGDLECRSPRDVMRLLSRCGVRPAQALTLCESFLFSMKTHVPYALEDDAEDLSLPNDSGAFSRFVASQVARPLIEDMISSRRQFLGDELYSRHVPRFWEDVKSRMKGAFGEQFYTNLLTKYPELLDYFNGTDMDKQSEHIVLAVDLIVEFPKSVGEGGGSFRHFTDHLGDIHSRLGIPTSAYPKVGQTLLDTLEPYASGYCQCTNWLRGEWNTLCPASLAKSKAGFTHVRGGDARRRSVEHLYEDDDSELAREAACAREGNLLTPTSLMDALLQLYISTMSFTFYPMLRQERTVASAAEFYTDLAEELSWSKAQLGRRLMEVNLEISSSGTYNQTSEEIQMGMRLAWRNSIKCIGRISWNTLEVRDRRHVTDPGAICRELELHMEKATAGTNIQSVMTVFRPRGPDEAFGMRFWTEQLVRYACYKDPETGELLGDPANLEFTSFLLDKGLWTPPEPKTRQDCLPFVFSIPGEDKPYVHSFASKYLDEAPMKHPDCPAVAELGYRWAAVPIIDTLAIDLGGIEYGTFPFNGWFCSTEIVRNLMERFPWNDELTGALKLDPDAKMLKLRLAHETEVVVNHSFETAGYTIVDPETVAEQFVVHCTREKDAGRECPSQWSWIGGLVGHTNPVWHMEMRDFRKCPQYEYTSHQWLVAGYADSTEDGEDDGGDSELTRSRNASQLANPILGTADLPPLPVPRVLIAYGSETGTAEAAAARLGRNLRLVRPTVVPLNELAGMDPDGWRPYTHVLMLCSTFGKGLAPTNAEDFFSDVEEKGGTLPPGCLCHAQVSVLALGSTIYPDFCKAGMALERMMLGVAGGTKLSPIAKADAACDSAGTVTEWVNLTTRLILPPQLRSEIESRLGDANEPLKFRMKWEDDVEHEQAEKGDAGHVKFGIVDAFEWPEDESVLCRINDELLENGDLERRSTRRIRFDVPPGQSYVSGDHLSVRPLNSIESVERFARCFAEELGGEGASLRRMLNRPFGVECEDNGHVYPARLPFSSPAALSKILQSDVGLGLTEAWAASAAGLLGQYVPESSTVAVDADALRFSHPFAKKFNELKHDILAGGKGKVAGDAMNEFLGWYPTVMDLLEEYEEYRRDVSGEDGDDDNDGDAAAATLKAVSLAEVLAILPRLQPRLYSISSSNKIDPTKVEISVGVVHLHTKEGVHVRGVCSNYLARLLPGTDRVNVQVRESSFRGPTDPTRPTVMVGAGTGLAPMMGFLTDRAMDLEQRHKEGHGQIHRNCHLFFGARDEGEQIYKDKVGQYEHSDVLQLHLALSRSEHVPKQYVQDKIRSYSRELAVVLLDPGCSYYVCGDAGMADCAYDACLDALKTRMSRVKAVQHLKLMRVAGRWQSDLWGVSETLEEDYNQAKKAMAKRKRKSAINWLNRVKKTDPVGDDDSDY
mmetsp:Transcript_21397/g.62513  ORF Transcript_21397/g.62513 Transcript_21397/m.62513 type:complete len:1837 (-) Transcript_21397:3416-8926(-)